jgi:LmbE family N-acetylglucosaminyl deacetylase
MKPMSADWISAVAVVAHPDDLEYGAAAAVARWTEQGKHVSYVLVSSGEAGIAGRTRPRSGRCARRRNGAAPPSWASRTCGSSATQTG